MKWEIWIQYSWFRTEYLKASLYVLMVLEFLSREFLEEDRIENLFMVEIRWVVLKLKMSQFTDVAEKEIHKPMEDEITVMEPEWSLFL